MNKLSTSTSKNTRNTLILRFDKKSLCKQTLLISCAILIFVRSLFKLTIFCILLAQHNTLQVLENRHDASIRIEINAKRYWHDYITFQIICWRLTGVNTWKSITRIIAFTIIVLPLWSLCTLIFRGTWETVRNLVTIIDTIRRKIRDWNKAGRYEKNERRESRGSLLSNIV